MFRYLPLVLIIAAAMLSPVPASGGTAPSVARQWNEELLEAIRNDFARPTVHARNLHHVSVAMWDAWAAFDARAHAVMHPEFSTSGDIENDRREAISHAAYRLLSHRFAASPGNDPDNPGDPDNTLNRLRDRMNTLGYDPDFNDPDGSSPASLGVRIANTVIQIALGDGANEANAYANVHYQPVNPPLDLDQPGNPDMVDDNRWQPLQRDSGFVDQSGNEVGSAQAFIGGDWGLVKPFALNEGGVSIHTDASDGWEHFVYLDPGEPFRLGGAGDADFKAGMVEVIRFSAQLQADAGETMDISPASLGNSSLGANDGEGYGINPHTGNPYASQVVPAGDYYRVISEYWADGPASETPPGHWFTLLNRVSDDPVIEHRIGGAGEIVDRLEWDVKAYLALGGAVHDAAVSAWSVKGYHDSVRPVSAIRRMAEYGQSSAPDQPAYHSLGLPLEPDLIEVITSETAAGRHAHLADHVGEIAVLSWRGHGHDPATETAGVGWILAKEWWPYQQPDFVTPPFAGYVSGHSTFSRAAARVLTSLTGDGYFPGGMGEYCVTQDEYLSFELGPSQDLCLQWARYDDAADESGRSRIYGGIHPAFDDLPGRVMGQAIGTGAWELARRHFNGEVHPLFRDSFTEP